MFSEILRSIGRFFFLKEKKSPLSEKRVKDSILKLKSILPFRIKDTGLYIKALTHRSYLEVTHLNLRCNERLEFLGDAVLDLIASDYLFRKDTALSEGDLTKIRSNFVDKYSLADTGIKLGLDKIILTNRNYFRDNDKAIRSIVADAFESLIGAIYLDQGLKAAASFVEKTLILPGIEAGLDKTDENYKGLLLEYSHLKKWDQPNYIIQSETGPQHNKKFVIEVKLHDEILGSGVGSSKKEAEQEAARAALITLKIKKLSGNI